MKNLWFLLALSFAGQLAAQDTVVVTASTQPPPATKYQPWRYIHSDIRQYILFELLDMPERGFPMWSYRALATRGTDIGFAMGAWRLSDTSGVVLAWWDKAELYRSGALIDSFPVQFMTLSDDELGALARQIKQMRAGTRVTDDEGKNIRNCMVAPFNERITVEACAGRVTLWIDRRTPLHVSYADAECWLSLLSKWFR